MGSLGFWLALAGFGFFASRRLPRYLHIFQQDDYNGERFLNWLAETRTFDRRVSLVLLGACVLGWLVADAISMWSIYMVLTLIFGVFGVLEPDPRKEAKKKLVMTERARRIFYASLALNIIAAALLLGMGSLLSVVAVQIIPLLLVVANKMLAPMEQRIQDRILSEAKARLAQIDPQVIGITGSFGKTSVKHILGHVLEMNASTFYTPGSVNTLMGISRMIRENLPADCKYFLVEMGAYGEGSIRKLCGLTPPQAGIITALGEAHIERFKSLDTVARAKFELAKAVLANESGRMIVHEDVLKQEYAAHFVQQYPTRFVLCGPRSTAGAQVENIEQTTTGLIVRLRWRGQGYTLTAPLFGAHHAGNMALAFATAVTLGVAPERVIAAMKTVPQIKHRLEVKLQPNGSIYIDDAFNSNPAGFAAALELMTLLAGGTPRRRIIVTPGLIELGLRHDPVHRELGAVAARHADVAIAVKADRIGAFVEGFRAAKPDGVLHPVANLAEALKWLGENGKPDDIVLIENDLPDVHERRLVL